MNWKCPNCGKRVVFSAEQLVETRGVVVCPQCLASDKVPGYDTPHARPKPTAVAATPPPTPSSTPQQHASNVSTPPPRRSRPTPPPHRPKINFAADGDSYGSTRPQQPVKSRKGGKKKKAKKSSSGFLAPMSSLGCLWRTVACTLVLLIIYIIFGLLLQGV